jgi:molecular chaperone GrpE (heat shock protein)
LKQGDGSPQKPETVRTNGPVAGPRQETDVADAQSKQDGAGKEDAEQTKEGDGADQQQNQLSQQAAALAAKLRELSGKDPRISHRFAEAMQQAAREMDQAAESWRTKVRQAANSHGAYALSGLSEVMQGLQQLLDQPKPSDMAFEEYPKAYEEIIAEYLKRLSYAE